MKVADSEKWPRASDFPQTASSPSPTRLAEATPRISQGVRTGNLRATRRDTNA
ncbi:hypothetical protein WN51_04088 [Melipona quadrifasciata]|uniref:Uncharacterized protein n=1 Tax=Melipona quadrifasciata TaxID=166423 RepID=A0A0N0U3F5_9HYME|nr:hypothetical protein WN51_04088 [Melipona quadrifasciata]